jgi:carbonic anhydrase
MLSNNVLGRISFVFGLVAVATGLAFATANHGPEISPDEALQRLMDGNKRYVENQMTGGKLCDITTRTSLAKSQKPYAVILMRNPV